MSFFLDTVIKKLSKRLDSWKRAHFSLDERITLIQSCVTSIPLYYLTLFNVPVGVARNLVRLMQDFWSAVGED